MAAVVVDASTVVAALLDRGHDGRWAEEVLMTGQLAAPHLLPAEVANIVRRAAMTGKISHDAACLAHADLRALRVELFPYWPFADRVWELQANVTSYDAWYVALAEYLECSLATLDARLSRAPGLKCSILLPEPAAASSGRL